MINPLLFLGFNDQDAADVLAYYRERDAERDKQDILGSLKFLLYQLEQAAKKEKCDHATRVSLLLQIREAVEEGFRYADKYECASGNTLGAKEVREACMKILATLPPT